MARGAVAIFALAVVILVAVFGGQAALDDAGPQVNIDAETWTPDPGNVTTLDHSNLENTDYDSTVTVRDGSGKVVDPNVDYIWFEENGTIQAVDGGELDGDNSAEIDYGYESSTEEHRVMASIIGTLFEPIGLILPLLGIVIVIKLLTGGL